MNHGLSDLQWQHLFQIIYRINLCEDYHKFVAELMSQLKLLVPFTKGIALRLSRTDMGEIISADPVADNLPDNAALIDAELHCNKTYSFCWREYGFYPWSSVFRTSDLRGDMNEWIKTDVYKKVYLAQNIHYSANMILIYEDNLLASVSFHRPKEDGDFTVQELFVLDVLKRHLAAKLYHLLKQTETVAEEKTEDTMEGNVQKVIGELEQKYRFTKQERTIVQMIQNNMDNDMICSKLYISSATLRKHLHNIYQKANVKSRLQLLQLLRTGSV